jgi:hypothetical protein
MSLAGQTLRSNRPLRQKPQLAEEVELFKLKRKPSYGFTQSKRDRYREVLLYSQHPS